MGPGGTLLNADSKKEGAKECIDAVGQNLIVQLALSVRRHLAALHCMRTAEIHEAVLRIISLYSEVVRNTWNAVSRFALPRGTAREAAEPPSLETFKTQLASSNLL